jgi:hypothetical protein
VEEYLVLLSIKVFSVITNDPPYYCIFMSQNQMTKGTQRYTTTPQGVFRAARMIPHGIIAV